MSIAVDCVVINPSKEILLIKRHPESNAYPGYWALPGGRVEDHERVRAAARRELKEETDLDIYRSARFINWFDTPTRDPRGRVVSFAYLYVLQEAKLVTPGDDATEFKWIPFEDILDGTINLAFDHNYIVEHTACMYEQVFESSD